VVEQRVAERELGACAAEHRVADQTVAEQRAVEREWQSASWGACAADQRVAEQRVVEREWRRASGGDGSAAVLLIIHPKEIRVAARPWRRWGAHLAALALRCAAVQGRQGRRATTSRAHAFRRHVRVVVLGRPRPQATSRVHRARVLATWLPLRRPQRVDAAAQQSRSAAACVRRRDLAGGREPDQFRPLDANRSALLLAAPSRNAAHLARLLEEDFIGRLRA